MFKVCPLKTILGDQKKPKAEEPKDPPKPEEQ
jgi:hypothetical protein